MIQFLKFILNYGANIIIWAYGLVLVRYGDGNLWWMSVEYALCLTVAYYISAFLGGRPNLNVRSIIAGALAFFTGNWIGAVAAPVVFFLFCIVIDMILARFGILFL